MEFPLCVKIQLWQKPLREGLELPSPLLIREIHAQVSKP